jgi:hypothetical protein
MSAITFLGELPPSKSPWFIATVAGLVILTNEDYEPMVIADGKLIGSRKLPPSGDSVRGKNSDSTTEVK